MKIIANSTNFYVKRFVGFSSRDQNYNFRGTQDGIKSIYFTVLKLWLIQATKPWNQSRIQHQAASLLVMIVYGKEQ